MVPPSSFFAQVKGQEEEVETATVSEATIRRSVREGQEKSFAEEHYDADH